MKHPEYEKIDVPRLSPYVKEMNGQSTRRLKQCLDNLTDLLDKDDDRESPQDRSVSDSSSE